MGGVVQHQHLYNKARWKRRSLRQRMREPLCAMCKARGIITPAQIADHIFPHDGDERAFFEGELQSLCLDCHLKIKGPLDHAVRRERSGQPTFSREVDASGWPVDPRHPANQPRDPFGNRRAKTGTAFAKRP